MSAFDNFGVSPGVKKGLAYRHDYSQSMNNMMNIKQYEDRKRQQREQEAMYVAQALSKQPVSAPISQKRYDAYYKDVIYPEYKKLQEENPRWREDPEAVTKFTELSQRVINNQIVENDLEYKKNRQMAMEDTESSMEYKANWLSKAEEWANQEFDPTKDPNDYQSNVPFPKYFKETQYGWDDVVLEMSNSYLKEFDVQSPKEENNFLYVEESMSDAKINGVYNLIVTDTQKLNALNKAYDLYKGTEIYKEIPISREEFAKSALKNSRTPVTKLKDYSLEYEQKLKQRYDISSIYNMPTRYQGFLADLSSDGVVKTSTYGLPFTAGKKKGNIINFIDSGAIIPNVGPTQSYEYNYLLKDAIVKGAGDLYYVKNNNSSYLKTYVTIPRPAGENAQNEIGLLNKIGFEVDNQETSAFAIETGMDPNILNQRFKTGFMSGWVYLPADINDPNNIMDYEAQFGKDQKTRLAVQARMPENLSLLSNTQRTLQSIDYAQDNPLLQALGYDVTDIENTLTDSISQEELDRRTSGDQMTNDQWYAKWSTLKSGESMVGLDGKTYTKK